MIFIFKLALKEMRLLEGPKHTMSFGFYSKMKIINKKDY